MESTNWISVDERLPKVGQEVLIYDPDFGNLVAKYDTVTYPDSYGIHINKFLVHRSISSSDLVSVNPTKWKPID